MKLRIGLALVTAIALISFILPPGKFTINGSVAGVDNGMAYLTRTLGEEVIKDSAKITNGKFSMSGKIDEPVFASFTVDTSRSSMGFFVEKGTITINTRIDTLYKGTVTGSKTQDIVKEWFSTWEEIRQRAGVLYRKLDAASDRGKKEIPEDIRKEVDDAFAQLSVDTKNAVIAFVKKYPSSPASPFIIIDRFINYPDPQAVKQTYALLKGDAKNGYYGRTIKEYERISAKTGIGARPQFALNDTNDKLFNINELKGKYVLVDFWASWCAPCRKENPNVVNAYKKYNDKGFEIVGISLDTKKDAWLKAIDVDGLTWKHVSDLKGWESDLVKEYGIKVVPTSFLLDKEGKVIAKDLRGEALHNKLKELLGE